MKILDLNNSNFFLYAAKNYNSAYYIEQEFFADLKKIKYLKRLLQKYNNSKILKERLILNHILVIYNVFGIEPANRMFFLKLKGYEKYLKPFLVFLNNLPDVVFGIGEQGENIHTIDIPMDQTIVEILRKI